MERAKNKGQRLTVPALCLSVLLLVVSCRVERPKDVISPEQMEDILYDYHLAQIMASELNGDEIYKRSLYMEHVYQKHHITRAQLDSSLVWYARYPENLSRIYDRLEARADREMEGIKARQAMSELRGPQPVEGDSADLWYGSRLLVLTSAPFDNRQSFTIPADSNFHLCDSIEWSFDVMFVPTDSSSRQMVASLMLRYVNDSLLARDVPVRADSSLRIALHNSDSVRLKEVKASVFYDSPDTLGHLLVSHNRLIRYHIAAPIDSLAADSLNTDSLTTDSLKGRRGGLFGRMIGRKKAASVAADSAAQVEQVNADGSSASVSEEKASRRRIAKSAARRASQNREQTNADKSLQGGDRQAARKKNARMMADEPTPAE